MGDPLPVKLPLLVSFYTYDTIYEKEVQDLRASCLAVGTESFIEGTEDRGSWQRNCCQKPLFILECLQKFQRPLLWVDADAIILRPPSFDFGAADIGLYFNNFQEKRARAGTIYVAPTEGASRFLIAWDAACKRAYAEDPAFLFGDQGQLPAVLTSMEADLNIAQLPLTYIHIFDRDPVPFDQTVILHTQASRTAKMDPVFWQHLSGRELKKLRMDNAATRTEFLQ